MVINKMFKFFFPLLSFIAVTFSLTTTVFAGSIVPISGLSLTPTANNSDIWSQPWSYGDATITKARVYTYMESGDYGYLYASPDGVNWSQVFSRTSTSEGLEEWVNLPAGTVYLKVRCTTDYKYIYGPITVYQAELTLNTPGQPQMIYDGGVTYWQQRVRWDSGGNPAGTTYIVHCHKLDSNGNIVDSREVYNGTGTEFVTNHLIQGAYYNFYVRAVSGVNRSSWTSPTPYWTIPSFTVTPSPGSLTVTYPKVMNGITYVIYWKPVTSGTWLYGTTSETSFRIPNLTSDTRYDVCMAPSLPAGGTGWWVGDPAGAKRTLMNSPKASIHSKIVNNSIEAYWDTNGNPSGTPYRVGLTDQNGNFVVGPTSWVTNMTSYTFNNLTPNTFYYVKVQTKNLDGVESPWEIVFWGTPGKLYTESSSYDYMVGFNDTVLGRFTGFTVSRMYNNYGYKYFVLTSGDSFKIVDFAGNTLTTKYVGGTWTFVGASKNKVVYSSNSTCYATDIFTGATEVIVSGVGSWSCQLTTEGMLSLSSYAMRNIEGEFGSYYYDYWIKSFDVIPNIKLYDIAGSVRRLDNDDCSFHIRSSGFNVMLESVDNYDDNSGENWLIDRDGVRFGPISWQEDTGGSTTYRYSEYVGSSGVYLKYERKTDGKPRDSMLYILDKFGQRSYPGQKEMDFVQSPYWAGDLRGPVIKDSGINTGSLYTAPPLGNQADPNLEIIYSNENTIVASLQYDDTWGDPATDIFRLDANHGTKTLSLTWKTTIDGAWLNASGFDNNSTYGYVVLQGINQISSDIWKINMTTGKQSLSGNFPASLTASIAFIQNDQIGYYGGDTLYLRQLSTAITAENLQQTLQGIDNIAPIVNVSIDGGNQTLSTTIPLIINAFDNKDAAASLQMRISTNGGSTFTAYETYSKNKSITIPSTEGTYEIVVAVKDTATNEGKDTTRVSYGNPSNQPMTDPASIGLKVFVGGSQVNPITYDGKTVYPVTDHTITLQFAKPSNVTKVSYALGDKDVQGTQLSLSGLTTVSKDLNLMDYNGAQKVYYKFQSTYGVDSQPTQLIMMLSKDAPKVTVTTQKPYQTASRSGSIGLKIIVEDPAWKSGFTYRLNGGSWTSLPSDGNINASLSQVNKLNTLSVEVKNPAGKIGTGSIGVFYISLLDSIKNVA